MKKVEILRQDAVSFPAAWAWLMDEAVPAWVKTAYSPRESWKDKPFSKEDARFFFRGIEELSELFTEERPKKLPSYLDHPRFRSAYLLYFLPLQAAKFVAVLEQKPEALEALIVHGEKTGAIRIADLGAGPATASIALLLSLLKYAKSARELPPIELHCYDTNRDILKDGAALVENLASHFPKLRGKVKFFSYLSPWWAGIEKLPECSAIFLGHVLNETPSSARIDGRKWTKLLERARGMGVLILEPASRMTSQNLSRLRDELLAEGAVENAKLGLAGPCPHSERCPLADGRDYCHFSVRAEVPGRWFREFSRGLGSERQWLKFSYLWLAPENAQGETPGSRYRLVISDPLGGKHGDKSGQVDVLLCEPDEPRRFRLPSGTRAFRGDWVRVD